MNPSGPTAGPRDLGLLRVVSYNVRDLLDDRDAVAHVVRSCRPDVVCLQEAPRRPLTAHRLRRLARETGLRWVGGGRASGGTALLVHGRLDVAAVQARRLPVAGLLTRRRGYVAATVSGVAGTELAGLGRVTVASIHLPLHPQERVDHSRQVLDALRSVGPPPFVVAGDLNELPGGPAWSALGDLVHDAAGLLGQADPTATFPARSPRQRIDAVLVSEGLEVTQLRAAGASEGLAADVLAAASDHLPLIADLRAAPGGELPRT